MNNESFVCTVKVSRQELEDILCEQHKNIKDLNLNQEILKIIGDILDTKIESVITNDYGFNLTTRRILKDR